MEKGTGNKAAMGDSSKNRKEKLFCEGNAG